MLLLTLVVAVAFFPVVLGRSSFYHLDLYFQHHPFWHYVWNSIREGQLPLWTPAIRAGYPLHANGEASMFYPPAALLGLLLPAHRAIDMFMLLHLVALGVFVFKYLRELAVSPGCAALGAVGFALSGRMVASTIWPNAVAASCYLPLALWGVERTRRDPRRGALLIAAAVGLGLLAGRPQRHVLSLLVLAAYGAVTLVTWPTGHRETQPRRRAGALAVLIGILLGLGIGAVQALPTWLLVRESNWAGGVNIEEWSMLDLDGKHLSTVLLPAGASSWPEARCYPGAVMGAGLLLAVATFVCGLIRRRSSDTHIRFFVVTALVCAGIAVGASSAHELCQAVPVLRHLRTPARLMFPAMFSVTIVAAIAIHRALAGRPRRTIEITLLAVLVLDLTATTWWTAPCAPSVIYRTPPDMVNDLAARVPDAVGSPGRSFCGPYWIEPRDIDGLDVDQVVNRFKNLPLTHNLAMKYGLRAAGGWGEPLFKWQAQGLEQLTVPRIEQLGARDVITPQPLRSDHLLSTGRDAIGFIHYENASALPRAVWVTQTERVRTFGDALVVASRPDFDAGSKALVEVDLEPVSADGSATAHIRLVDETPTRVTLQVQSPSSGFLVLFDTWAPGWSAAVNGAPVPVHRANGMFRLVRVPAGTARVVFDYLPPGFALGAGLSAASTLAWVLGTGGPLIRRRRAARRRETST